MRRLRLVVLGLSVALALAIVGLIVLARRSSAHAGEAERESRRAFDAETRIRWACYSAASHAWLTLRAFDSESPEVGFDLALRDASNTALCGGDAVAITGPVMRGDVDATLRAVHAQYEAWCPTCTKVSQELARELLDAGADAPPDVVDAGR